MMDKVCEASQRGSSARSVSQALEVYQEMRLNGHDKQILDFAQRSKHTPLDFYNSLVQCAVRMGKPVVVEELVKNMRATEVPRSRAFYEGTMKILAGKKLFHQALAMYDLMVEDGFEPSSVTCSCLVSFSVEVGDLDRAITSFEKLSQMERPSIRAYMTILRVYSKRHEWSRSIEAMKDMQRRGLAADSLILNIVLATCVHADRLDQAEKLLEDMLGSTTQTLVDVVSYNTVIKGCALKGELSKARSLLESMTSNSVKPNVITFNTVMDAAMRCKKPVEAWDILKSMQKAGFVPDKYSCSILVKGFHEGNPTKTQVSDSLQLLRTMSDQSGRSPAIDAKLLDALLQSLLDATMALKDTKLTQEVLEQMKLQKVAPRSATCSALIKNLNWRD